MAERPAGADRAQHRECEILGRRPLGKPALNAYEHRPGEPVDERLRRKNVFDFGSPDAEAQSAERTVGRRVTVSADDDHARTHEPLLVHHDMLDALMSVVRAVKGLDAVAPAVVLERLCLPQRGRIGNDARRDVRARNNVVDHAEMRVGRKSLHASLDEACKSLRARIFVGKVQVCVEKNGVLVYRAHHVLIKNLLVQGPGHGGFSKCGRSQAMLSRRAPEGDGILFIENLTSKCRFSYT